ncbi:MAG TPA: CBS domain-containing protein [Anaerolineae bacterium]|nr:CBS domain-containing protein [Anaerolineae bacterium]
MYVILTHEHTDFDALASLLAAHKLYPDAIPVLPRTMNRNLRDFLALYRGALPFVSADDLPRRRVRRAILVDTQSVQPPKGMGPGTECHIIDHHPLTRELEPGWTYWGEPVGATTTLLVERIAEEGIPLSAVEATLLMLGIYEDTGSLTYATTTPRDIRCAAWVLEQGANLQVVNEFLHHPLTPSQQRLYQELIENTRSLDIAGHSIIIATGKAEHPTNEISTLAHKLRDLYEPAALFLLVEMDDRVQLVARSTTDDIDVGVIASALGGGGHTRAAAAVIRDQVLETVQHHLIELLHSHVKPPVRVASIMSWGVQTLKPDASIREADERMRHFGFEGFPVVDPHSGRVVGMVTRPLVDRALRHGLHDEPVRRIMKRGEVTVSPDDSISHLQHVMMQHDWGQIPVVNQQGTPVGIVTRTDLIKLWGGPTPLTRAEEIAARMEKMLPASYLRLLQHAGATAAEMGYPLYVVGGFVRDLLLGYPNMDLDLVVEGDAIKLARQLARTYGGRVRSHRRFGTAKWILRDGQEAGGSGRTDLLLDETGPASLDFVTARTEFYEHPTALPTVERSSIKLDLHRRDFTINTLAIRLDPEHWGELLDFYGGEQDLRDRLIRVLHSLSFVEDPTRILRAVRFEQRFGFRIEARTQELIADALDLLDRVSPARIRHELESILEEREPERALSRLQELGVLRHLHKALRVDEWLKERFAALRKAKEAGEAPLEPMARLYFALLAYRLTLEQQRELEHRLRLRNETRELLTDVRELKAKVPQLSAPGLARSQIYRLLAPHTDVGRFILRLAEEDPVLHKRLDLFDRELRHVHVVTDGHYLRSVGVPPGPIYRHILQALRDARLDGLVNNEEEEHEMVACFLEEWEEQ